MVPALATDWLSEEKHRMPCVDHRAERAAERRSKSLQASCATGCCRRRQLPRQRPPNPDPMPTRPALPKEEGGGQLPHCPVPVPFVDGRAKMHQVAALYCHPGQPTGPHPHPTRYLMPRQEPGWPGLWPRDHFHILSERTVFPRTSATPATDRHPLPPPHTHTFPAPPGTTLNPTTDRCHISIDACGQGTKFDTAQGLCVARALPGHAVERRSVNPTVPKIATDAGSVVVSGSSVVLNTDSCPNAALDVCAIGQSIQTVQTNLDQASATLVRTAAATQTLGESINRTATAQSITNSDVADLASLLAATQAALNVSRCERNPVDSCGFSKVCDGGPVQPHTAACVDCGSFHDCKDPGVVCWSFQPALA